jgi:hypothetical protein
MDFSLFIYVFKRLKMCCFSFILFHCSTVQDQFDSILLNVDPMSEE